MSYILYHLELAWAFVRGQDEALYGMDVSRRGLWLSFLAIVIVEPVRLLYAFLFGQMDNFLLFREGGLGLYGLELLLDWGMGPLVFFGFCTIFGFRDRLVPLIVSMNWLSVVVLMIILLPGAFASLGFVPAILALTLMLGIYGFTLWISYRLYRFVLGCPPSMAVGLAVLMLVLGLWSIMVLNRLTEALPAA